MAPMLVELPEDLVEIVLGYAPSVYQPRTHPGSSLSGLGEGALAWCVIWANIGAWHMKTAQI